MIQRLQVKRNEKGFTLIELLIVIIVLGILAAIVVFAVGSTRSDSVASACKTNVKSVELSAEAVNTTVGHYPIGASVTTSDEAATAGVLSPSTGALLKTWPTSSDYAFEYVGPKDPTDAAAAATNVYHVEVYKTDGSSGGGTFTTGATGTDKGASTDGCAAL